MFVLGKTLQPNVHGQSWCLPKSSTFQVSHSFLLANIRVDTKGFEGANTLAYLPVVSATKSKVLRPNSLRLFIYFKHDLHWRFAVAKPQVTATAISWLSWIMLQHIEIMLVVVTLPTAGNTKGGSITVPLTSCSTGLESAYEY